MIRAANARERGLCSAWCDAAGATPRLAFGARIAGAGSHGTFLVPWVFRPEGGIAYIAFRAGFPKGNLERAHGISDMPWLQIRGVFLLRIVRLRLAAFARML